MNRRSGTRLKQLCVIAVLIFAPTLVQAQTIGTFSWQLQPFCNVYVFTVTVDGAAIRLTGFDDRCGAGTRSPAAGTVTLNNDGTYTLSFYEVASTGLASHTTATLSGATPSGPWTDSAGNSGTFQFGVPGPVGGTPRGVPTLSTLALADGSVTNAKVAAGAIDSARIADGSVTTADLADGSVTSAKIAASSVGSAHIIDGSIAAADLAVASVTAPKLALPLVLASAVNGIRVDSASGLAIHGTTANISSAGVLGDNTTGEAVVGRNAGGAGVGAVVGRNDGAGYGVRGFNTSNGYGVVGQAGLSTSTGIAARFENVNASSASDVVQIVGAGSGDLIQASQAGATRFRVTSVGNVQADGTYTTPAADLAEFIDSDDAHPGDVVEIDPLAPGRFRLAATPASPAVAGVITTEPGVLLAARNGRQSANDGPALALAGRVPVKVSAESGAISPGDLLVASSTPGHAMKAPASPAAGTVVGKALGTLVAGTGVIEMLVMLR